MNTPPPRVPIFDNHFHMDPRGRHVDAVKEFERAGGTHMMLVHKPYHRDDRTPAFNTTVADHRAQMEVTLALAERARSGTGVEVWVALAPHPAEFTTMLEGGHSLEDADAVYRGALDVAAGFVRDGKAVALGEVGRPHWEGVPEDVWAWSNAQMDYAFTLCKELGVPAIIHCETGTEAVYADLAKHCDAVGLAREKAIKHFSPPLVDEDQNHGLFPSVLIGKNAAEDALKQGTRFMMETDHMDDPRYPGAVLGPKTVPKRTRTLLEAGAMSEEDAWRVHGGNPAKVYGIEITL